MQARELGAAVELRYLHAPREVLIERIRLRRREQPAIEPEALSQWFEIFETPTSEEMDLYDKPPELV